GLPGLLLTMGNSERKEPLTLIGPKGLQRVVSALRVVAPELPFPIEYCEFNGQEADFKVGDYEIHAFRVNHNVPCFGYRITVSRLGLFMPERAKENDVPLKYWNRLQHGETIEEDGRIYTPDLVMGPPRKGLKLVYSTDTRPTDSIRENAEDADLLILEGMYGEYSKLQGLREKKHMLMQEACEIARDANVKELWLTHFSPAVMHPEEYREELQKIFPNTVIPKDGHGTDLMFPD
ncbi:MAG: ribonuclease Z, partial [Lachnospiraceae bacterium]|nr:ribonuclease Z [Lachnospiraceae bacterium]